MLPNDSDAPFLDRRGGAERHEESENGVDGEFRNKAIKQPPVDGCALPEGQNKATTHHVGNTIYPIPLAIRFNFSLPIKNAATTITS